MRTLNYARLLLALAFTAFTGYILTVATQCTPTVIPLFCAMCFSSVYWLPKILLLKEPIRLPILEEEIIIGEALQHLKEKSGDLHPYKILIEESVVFNAAATGLRTIIVSRHALQNFTAEELEAVMAHEIGHLRSGDTIANCAMHSCALFIDTIVRVYKLLFRIAGRITLGKLWLLAIVLAVLFLMNAENTVVTICALLFLNISLQFTSKIFSFLSLFVSRYSEYKQDVYAQSFGYGAALKSALIKISNSAVASPISWWHITLHGTHPILHHRIRRLEKLEGLR